MSIDFGLGGIREPVVDTLTGWLTDSANPFPDD